MKSTLSIIRPGPGPIPTRTVEVPCRLPEAFTFSAQVPGTGSVKFVAELTHGLELSDVCLHESEPYNYGDCSPMLDAAEIRAESILATIKAALGITGPVPPGSPLPALALAYEAEVAAYEASLKAFNALPVEIVQVGLCGSAPDSEGPTGIRSPAARMLAKYVEHVVEQAAKEVK